MTASIHPAASSAHPPFFITAPGETDALMVVMGVILVLFVFAVGIVYFHLHALPDRFAHKKVQLEIVCVLGLLAMFTHRHIFWIAGLLLALVDFPDFSTPLNRIAGSVERVAGLKLGPVKRWLTQSPIDKQLTSMQASQKRNQSDLDQGVGL